MAGLNGFIHMCYDEKIDKQNFRCSLRDSSFSNEECNIIWDFYVARSFAASTTCSISLEEYGWKDTTSKIDGYPALEEALALSAGIEKFAIIRGKTIKDTLSAMDLANDRICVSHPRAVLMQDFSFELDENESVKIKSKESRISAIFRHIRNSFAHGNTYFFENGMCLLEDKDKGKITAAILVPMDTLINWIAIVDKNKIQYDD